LESTVKEHHPCNKNTYTSSWWSHETWLNLDC
jgi:hypothetical protein